MVTAASGPINAESREVASSDAFSAALRQICHGAPWWITDEFVIMKGRARPEVESERASQISA